MWDNATFAHPRLSHFATFAKVMCTRWLLLLFKVEQPKQTLQHCFKVLLETVMIKAMSMVSFTVWELLLVKTIIVKHVFVHVVCV